MKASRLTADLSVAPQLTAKDLEQAAAAGFKSVINNRPDGEAADQPGNEELASAAKRLGLEYRHIPVVASELTGEQIKEFGAALAEMNKPTLAFCRTGTRSTTLWALASAGQVATNAILQTASAAGYDLEHLRPRLDSARNGSA